ncbi:hypothetical protein INT45_010749 [Circinella minor]|uniref:Uncharacterized protein n=1 Tax=Circinella minor TaxID=1195481 RepID=A0A8H7S2P9_9FUNG|nr:hypothetical protein INT45_010749 [Circinella minor]
MAESSKEGSSRSRGAGRDTEKLLEKMLYGSGTDLMDLDDIEEAFKDNEDDIMENDEKDSEEEEDWDENVDDEITQVFILISDLDELARDFEDFEDNLIVTKGIGKTRHGSKRRVLQGEERLAPEVKELLGEANLLYISQDYGKAIDFLQNLITKYPNVHQAWNTLGLVHEEMGHQDKALQLRMVAAHMNQSDSLLWKELGVKSINVNANQQAIYCFTKALVVDPTDLDALWDRSYIYKEMGREDEAIDGFLQVLELVPHHFKAINELVRLYRRKGMVKDAIQLYEKAVEYHMENDTTQKEEDEDEERRQEEEDELSDRFGYAEVNMLSELYLMQNDYRRSLETIKTGIRYVQHRQHETYWDSYGDNDQEYFEDPENEERSDFPIELRVRMGVCRVYLGDVRTAAKHFQYLLNYPATTYPDLHQDIAYAYMDKRHYEPALNVFQKIVDVSDEIEVDVLIRTADCYHQVGELETAALFYSNVLEEQPENMDVMLSLATIYEEQGKEEHALELANYVMQKTREVRRKKKEEERQKRNQELEIKKSSTDEKPQREKASIFDETGVRITKVEYYRRRRNEFKRQEEEKDRFCMMNFAKIAELDPLLAPNVIETSKPIMREYIYVAQELYNEFTSTNAFYPSNRSRRYTETGFFNRTLHRQDKRSLDREAHQMARRLRGRVDTKVENNEEDESDEEIQRRKDEDERDERFRSGSIFRGASFDVWCDLFIKYGYMLAVTQPETAYDVLKRVSEANVFYHDPQKIQAIKLALLGCSLINNNDVIKYEVQRWFMTIDRFKPYPYHLMLATTKSGPNSLLQYTGFNHMKYMMRTVRLIDTSLIEESKKKSYNKRGSIKPMNDTISGIEADPSATMARLNFNELFEVPDDQDRQTVLSMHERGQEIPTVPIPIHLNMFGFQLTIGKTFNGACLLLMRAYALEPNDPINTLSLAVTLFMRAMNRRTTNRHFQIMQGFYFLNKYRKLRGYCQETEYNFGRAFHLLGLTHLAVPHYERVLVMSSANEKGKISEESIESIYEYDEEYEDNKMEEEDDDDDDDSSFKKEAAYNLHLIYVTSGAPHLAKLLLAKYCTV